MDSGIVEKISKIVGAENIITSREELACFSFDATNEKAIPSAVCYPSSSNEISEILKLANIYRFPVVPKGAGSNVVGGTLAGANSLILSLEKMNRILQIDADNLFAVVESGVVNADFQKEVEKLGLFYPPDPASLNFSTLGGNVAEGAGGPRAVKYGTTKDYVMGLEVVLPTGEVINCGVKTVKSVAGYDLTRLFVGSEGTLGIITKITLRLIPKPYAIKTMVAFFNDVSDAAITVSEIIKQKIIPVTLELLDDFAVSVIKKELFDLIPDAASALLLIEVDGPKELIEKEAEDIRNVAFKKKAISVEIAKDEKEAAKLWKVRRGLMAAVRKIKPARISEDVAVPRSRLAELIKEVKKIADEFELIVCNFGHAGDGNLHVNFILDPKDLETRKRIEAAIPVLFKTVLSMDGTISGEHGIGTLKAPFLKDEAGDIPYSLMWKIKQLFDPNNILNPGKVFLA